MNGQKIPTFYMGQKDTIRGSFGKVYIVRFSYPSFELARWRNSVHSASRVTLVRVYAGHAAGRDLGAAAAMLI